MYRYILINAILRPYHPCYTGDIEDLADSLSTQNVQNVRATETSPLLPCAGDAMSSSGKRLITASNKATCNKFGHVVLVRRVWHTTIGLYFWCVRCRPGR